MYETFNESARTAVVAAQEHARELRSLRITPAHVLVGALAQPDQELTVTVLSAHGITRDGLLAELASLPQISEAEWEADEPVSARQRQVRAERVRDAKPLPPGEKPPVPFSRNAKRILELALYEAMRYSELDIGAQYLVLGILQVDDPATVAVLGGADVVEAAEAELRAALEAAA
ncbi:hypothetical protein GCM10011591_22500 [Nocardia camponoti]|uniref:Clp R domain-containing protein n=2 Tax=Nocardia camponoti TaxID=1616106 RepID=A0A917V8V1_9NOCA|nr:hypothetical protein GCM10011591_22500 [Nocardia camponoti]